MILIDTSIWVDHFGKADGSLAALLDDGLALAHPFVIGELALGNLPRRQEFLADMELLPKAVVATPAEFAPFIERHELYGSGLGYVDAHLLMSTYLTEEAVLWTRDKRLRAVAERLGVAADLS